MISVSFPRDKLMNTISRIASIVLTATLMVIAVSAQKDTIAAAAGDKYVISANAGGVNYIEGQVSIVRKLGKSGTLLKRDRIEIGDVVSTGPGGKVEILLNPGSYLRLGENSSFEFITTSLDDLQLRLVSGSAILEVFAADEFTVSVKTPKSAFTIIDSGIYRVDVTSVGDTFAVWKGKARLGDANGKVIKGGREATLSKGQVAVAKFDRDEKDAFDTWSKSRAKELAKISNSLAQNSMRTSLIRSFFGSRWSIYDSFGLWVYDPFSGAHCFLPFGYGWNSPYGYGFGHNIWYYNLPSTIYYPSNTQTTKTDIRTSRLPTHQPPFVKVQGDARIRKDPVRADPGDAYDPAPVRSAPVFVPPMPSGSSEKVDIRRKP